MNENYHINQDPTEYLQERGYELLQDGYLKKTGSTERYKIILSGAGSSKEGREIDSGELARIVQEVFHIFEDNNVELGDLDGATITYEGLKQSQPEAADEEPRAGEHFTDHYEKIREISNRIFGVFTFPPEENPSPLRSKRASSYLSFEKEQEAFSPLSQEEEPLEEQGEEKLRIQIGEEENAAISPNVWQRGVIKKEHTAERKDAITRESAEITKKDEKYISWKNLKERLYNSNSDFDELRKQFLLTYRWYYKNDPSESLITEIVDDFIMTDSEETKKGIILFVILWLRNPQANENEHITSKSIEEQLGFTLLKAVQHSESKEIRELASSLESSLMAGKGKKTPPKFSEVELEPTGKFLTFGKKKGKSRMKITQPNVFLLPGEFVKKAAATPRKIRGRKNPKYWNRVKEFAEDLDTLSCHLMARISLSEFADRGWQKTTKEITSPNLLELTSQTNDLSNFIILSILDQPAHLSADKQLKNISKRIEFFIDVAIKAENKNNFMVLFAITSALSDASIYRLFEASGVSEKRQKKFEKLLEYTKNNFEKLKTIYGKSDPQEIIPFLGMYLSELEFIVQGNPKTNEKGDINLKRMELLANTLEKISSMVPTVPNTPVTTDIRKIKDFKTNFVKQREEVNTVAYEKSLVLKPREPKNT